MSVIIDGTSGVTTPGVVNTAGETIATTLAVTGASTLTGAVTASTTLDVTGASTLTGQVTATNGVAVAAGLATGTGIGAAGAGNDLRLYVNGTQSATITTAGLLQFNSGYGSVATAYGCRAWVNFNGTGSGTFAGGASTVTRIAASTTATITTTTAHGLITGNTVYALTGVVAGAYTVTVLTTTTFTITTVATTALTAVSITFAVNTIRASGNVSSITDNGTGDYTVNFTTAIVDANYSVHLTGQRGASSSFIAGMIKLATTPTTSAVNVVFMDAGGNVIDPPICCAAIFR